ncbi:MICOS complex subunit MIC26, partial [Lecanoromycetidae sp. Uapishka_2]
MAFRSLLRRQGTVSPVAIGGLAAGVILYPTTTLYAEEPPEEHISRKPIYDDLTLIRNPPQSRPTPTETTAPHPPTPTDRLAEYIHHGRKFVYAHTLIAEDRINSFMSSILHQERAFTQTIASLAPPPETHERIMPGALYVLVAAMGGSIISRNRNILLRASVPVAVGIGAAWYVLPHTTRNVADLVWTYEEKAPLISMNHMRIRGAIEESWKQTKIRAEITKKWSDERVKASREAIEKWVRKE